MHFQFIHIRPRLRFFFKHGWFLLLVFSSLNLWAGEDSLRISIDLPCQACHIPSQWDIIRPSTFSHDQTDFPLEGQHRDIDCFQCHTGTTVQMIHEFSRVQPDCQTCHNDPHQGQLGENCTRCHTPATWQARTEIFDHNTTRLPLLGAHARVACDGCHKTAGRNEYQGLPLNCSGCHLTTFQATRNPNHAAAGFSTNCLECHKISAPAWQTSIFDHNQTNFPLTGQHLPAACSDCHQGQTAGTPRDCWSCHADVYQTSENPPHAIDNFPQDCSLCHATQGWQSSTFDHNQFGFALAGGHAQLTCDNCHENQNFTTQSGQCNACHADEVVDKPDFSHELAGFGPTCEQCHNVFVWTRTTYSHDIQTTYPLTGAHRNATCGSCHNDGTFQDLTRNCYDCHQTNYEAATNPEHNNAGFPTECSQCHTTAGWSTETIDHDLTAFPLVGLHKTVNCTDCHADGYDLPLNCEGCHDYSTATVWDHEARQYPTTCDMCHTAFGWTISSFNHTGVTNGCNACHAYDFNQTVSSSAPDHVASNFSTECQVCHSTQTWSPSFYDHSEASTGFPLVGAHAALIPNQCTSCHIDNQWTGIPRDCYGCHAREYTETTAPDHEARGYPPEICEVCHNTVAFQPGIFLHANTAAACATCHQYDYDQTTAPNHTTNGFSAQCQICHTNSAWQPDILDHDQTGFPLVGEHSNTSCNQCHINDVYAGTPTSCGDTQCHLGNFNNTTNPDHQTQGFRPEDCALCHTAGGWNPAVFDHSLATAGFALTGAHASQTCESCHVDYVSPDEIRGCESSGCHLATFNDTREPDHQAKGFRPEDCALCHSPVGWTPSIFTHDNLVETCAVCHSNDVPTAPDHANFPTNCEVCHYAAGSAWLPVHFDHSEELTGFPLVGQHYDNTYTNCNLCHLNNQWSGISHDCFSADCHATAYTGTIEPVHGDQIWAAEDCAQCHTPIAWNPSVWNHTNVTTCMPCHTASQASAQDPPHTGFSNTCEQCHTTGAWSPAAFDHTEAQTGFTLDGAHLQQNCAICHANGYDPPATPRTCADASCHLADYNNSTNPNHVSAGFPTDCQSCHTTTEWQGADFDHDATYFPIYTGKHRNRWDACSDCHTNTANYAEFTCFGAGCHSVSDMNGEHCEGNSCTSCNGFTYPNSGVNSADCLFCHPTGDKHDCGDDLNRPPNFKKPFIPDWRHVD